MKHKYKGKLSKKFWNKVNKLTEMDRNELYSLGVCLQNLEEFVLERLGDAERKKIVSSFSFKDGELRTNSKRVQDFLDTVK